MRLRSAEIAYHSFSLTQPLDVEHLLIHIIDEATYATAQGASTRHRNARQRPRTSATAQTIAKAYSVVPSARGVQDIERRWCVDGGD